MELWDIYDKDRVKTGKTMVRGSEFAPDSYHMVVHVCIFNSKGEMLIQQRQPFKEGFSNMWDITVGGSATMGDSSQTAAEREVQEEIGLKLDLQGVRPHLTINFDRGFIFFAWWKSKCRSDSKRNKGSHSFWLIIIKSKLQRSLCLA